MRVGLAVLASVGAAGLTHAAQPSVCHLNTPGQPQPLALPEDVLPPLHRLPDGRTALVATRSGWVLRLDLAQARVSAQVRVGETVTTTALSAPRPGLPSLLAVANDVPRTLVVLDEWLTPLQTLALRDKTGHTSSTVLGITTAPERQSFVLALKDVPELWEISTNPRAPEISVGWVHDFQYREGQFVPGYLNPQRTELSSLALDFALVQDGHAVLTRHAAPQPNAVHITHLDVRRHVPAMPVPSWPVVPKALAPAWTCIP